MNQKIEVIALPKEQWKGHPIMMVTKSDSYYDLEFSPLDKDGCQISMIKKPAEKEIVHTPEEYDFPDSLYQDHWEMLKPTVLFLMTESFLPASKCARKNGRTG